MAEADARAARVSQFLAKLSQEAELSSLALGPYTRVVDSCITHNASMRRGNTAVEELPYIGPPDRAPDPPPAGGIYASIEHLLGEANGDILAQRFGSYVKCCFVSLRMQEDDISAGERAVWNAMVEANATFVALEDEERLDPFRVALKAWYIGKRRPVSAARAGGGAGGGGSLAPGGAAGIQALTPELPELAKEVTPSQKYRFFKSLLIAQSRNKIQSTSAREIQAHPG